jgi:hypothetical protein
VTGRAVHLEGLVVRRPFGTGSKSERRAVVLESAKGDFVLRRKGGLAFGDRDLEALVGKRIRCTGTVAGYTLLITSYAEVGGR